MEIFRERDCMMFEASFTGFCEKEGALQARYLKTSGAAQQKLVLFGAAPCCSVLVWLESLRFTEALPHVLDGTSRLKRRAVQIHASLRVCEWCTIVHAL